MSEEEIDKTVTTTIEDDSIEDALGNKVTLTDEQVLVSQVINGVDYKEVNLKDYLEVLEQENRFPFFVNAVSNFVNERTRLYLPVGDEILDVQKHNKRSLAEKVTELALRLKEDYETNSDVNCNDCTFHLWSKTIEPLGWLSAEERSSYVSQILNLVKEDCSQKINAQFPDVVNELFAKISEKYREEFEKLDKGIDNDAERRYQLFAKLRETTEEITKDNVGYFKLRSIVSKELSSGQKHTPNENEINSYIERLKKYIDINKKTKLNDRYSTLVDDLKSDLDKSIRYSREIIATKNRFTPHDDISYDECFSKKAEDEKDYSTLTPSHIETLVREGTINVKSKDKTPHQRYEDDFDLPIGFKVTGKSESKYITMVHKFGDQDNPTEIDVTHPKSRFSPGTPLAQFYLGFKELMTLDVNSALYPATIGAFNHLRGR